MKYLKLLIYILILKEIPEIAARIYADGVILDKEWPIEIKSLIQFTVTKDFTENSILVIEILNKDKITKFLKISEPQYVDSVTDYYTIKKGIKTFGNKRFIIKMLFWRKSHNTKLKFLWYPNGVEETNKEALNDPKSVIYSANVILRKKWKVTTSIDILEMEPGNKRAFYRDEKYFQQERTARITCSAFEGLPEARVRVSGLNPIRFRDTAYNEALNTWVGYITLSIHDHNINISCYVDGTEDIKTTLVKVNHPTTLLLLDPEFTGFTKNGSKIRCYSHDGYPVPIIKWDFISVKNHTNPKSLYQIKNDELIFSPDVPQSTKIEFNCTSVYTNPLTNEIDVLKKPFIFEFGEASHNIGISTTSLLMKEGFEKLNKAAIGAAAAGVIIMIIAVTIVILLCRSKPKPSSSSTHRQEGSPKYAGSLLAGSKSALHNQMKSHNGASSAFISNDTNVNSDQNEFNYDDMPRGRRPIKIVDEPVVYSTIVGTMQPKIRPSLDMGPIDRV